MDSAVARGTCWADDDGLTWRKARASTADNGCVEVGMNSDGGVRAIRDPKSPECGHLAVTPRVFAALLADVKRGELGLGE